MTWVYNTTDTAWSGSFNRSNYVSQTFTATSGQTSFTVSGGYLPSLVEVYQNGVLLVNGTDVTVTSGTAVVLAVGATTGDIIQVIGNQTFNYQGTVAAANGGTGLTSPGAAGNVLTSNGTGWTSSTPQSTLTGEILLSTAASKSGFLKCDGTVYSRSSYSALAAALGTPLFPKDTLANALSSSITGYIFEANGLLFKNGTVAQTAANQANFANAFQTSTDGITWSLMTGLNIYDDPSHNPVAYGNGRYVLNTRQWNYFNYIWLVSTDGVNWTRYASTTAPKGGDSNEPCDVVFGGTSNRFVRQRVGQSSCCGGWISSFAALEYSTDGVTWTLANTNNAATNYNFGSSITHLAGYSGGFVATQGSYNGNTGVYSTWILYSADGATWTDITSNVNSVAAIGNFFTGCSYVNGRFIVTTQIGQMYTSTTGASGTWSLLTATSFVGGRIRGNSNGYVQGSYYSTDLLNWCSPINYGLGGIYITATPATGTRFYGTASRTGSYYTDLYNYTTATQFPVPYMPTRNLISGSSIPLTNFIKT
jgi:hypothetical protein